MKIAVFLDAPHQQKYVGVIKETFADVHGVIIEAAGPGVAHITATEARPRRRLGKWTGKSAEKITRKLYGHLKKWIGKSARKNIRKLYGHLKTICRRSLVILFMSDARWRKYLENHIFAFHPDHVILLEDNVEGLTGIVAQIAREKDIPYSILPDYIPNPAEPARFYYSDISHSADTWSGRFILRFAPQWGFDYEGKILLRLPPVQILVKRLRKQKSLRPWILNAGYCEAVYLESQAMKDHYQNLGFIEEKLRIVGGAMEDRLYEIFSNRPLLRHNLFDRYGFASEKPLILCGFPPDQYNASTEAFEYRSYDDLCTAWFEELSNVAHKANIVIVRHPRLPAASLAKYLRPNVILSDQTIEELLPLCDLYIACVSTTIRSALALAIPTINYDCYRYAYGDFSRAAAIVEVDSREHFQASLENAMARDNLIALKAVAAKDSAYWGVIDGGFKARLREAVLDVSRSYCGRPTGTHDNFS